MVGEFTVDLRDGRSVSFDEIVVLERKNGKWIRCIRDEPTLREDLPETTKYYHIDTDVERIVIEPDGELHDPLASEPAIETAVAEDGPDRTERRLLE